MANRLAKETSPYLLQHAHNPVDWYPWGEEAFEKARTENKPVLVSIGYAACHWCHVMERESFENEATAAIMNEHFVNIKIDREERPDIDHIYMDALQAMSGQGGWPLNVFLLPDRRPFYGGTYFPPQAVYNRPSWTEVLTAVSDAFNTKRADIEQQAANLTQHLENSNQFGMDAVNDLLPREEQFTAAQCNAMALAILGQADKEWGGFGRAPKFPGTFSISYLLRYYRMKKDDAALQQALLSLDKMIDGGINDQLGGGFARYSTDEKWLAPHFEKMLYDNALLTDVLCEAWQLTGEARYAVAVQETLGFLERELTSPEGGFYSALDADSEGVEGKFYVWSEEEVMALLGADGPAFCAYFDVSRHGNWEDANILWVPRPIATVAAEQHMSVAELETVIRRSKPKLLEARAKRVRPGLDDKILLGWNALMVHALCKAAGALGEEKYAAMAERAMRLLMEKMRRPGEAPAFWHTYKNGEARYPAFLDDYAALIRALIALQEVTGNLAWLREAKVITNYVTAQFGDETGRYFYYTESGQEDVIVRKKEVYDGAVPSGNALMAHNLWHLSIVYDEKGWAERALAMTASLGQTVMRYPTSFGVWAAMVMRLAQGEPELAVAGPEYLERMKELNAMYLPFKVMLGADNDVEDMPLLQNRRVEGKTLVYVCREYRCERPVEYISEINNLI
ncbi:thioredoxin domain-containing protein [Chitinophaga rhizosphaerae]|uniref:thioredoxin domain-containing protein n=1 Tax=Chitinophaga rhizosphaerae TaxID=1864947 RepID=UPI000F80D4B0|nr:thioredoxin domain-containing protein [Chitinophaga rhizosphaerae]